MSFSKLLTAGVLVASLVGGAAQASEASASAASYTARHDYSYPYHGYYGANSAGGGNRASADYGGQYTANVVASADPTQNGFAGESYGANSAGGGNRA